jgi:transposase, IS6 family
MVEHPLVPILYRPVEYLNNQIEQDHRQIKRLVKPELGVGSFATADCTLERYETTAIIRKGQVQGANRGDVMEQISFIHKIFEIAA